MRYWIYAAVMISAALGVVCDMMAGKLQLLRRRRRDRLAAELIADCQLQSQMTQSVPDARRQAKSIEEREQEEGEGGQGFAELVAERLRLQMVHGGSLTADVAIAQPTPTASRPEQEQKLQRQPGEEHEEQQDEEEEEEEAEQGHGQQGSAISAMRPDTRWITGIEPVTAHNGSRPRILYAGSLVDSGGDGPGAGVVQVVSLSAPDSARLGAHHDHGPSSGSGISQGPHQLQVDSEVHTQDAGGGIMSR